MSERSEESEGRERGKGASNRCLVSWVLALPVGNRERYVVGGGWGCDRRSGPGPGGGGGIANMGAGTQWAEYHIRTIGYPVTITITMIIIII